MPASIHSPRRCCRPPCRSACRWRPASRRCHLMHAPRSAPLGRDHLQRCRERAARSLGHMQHVTAGATPFSSAGFRSSSSGMGASVKSATSPRCVGASTSMVSYSSGASGTTPSKPVLRRVLGHDGHGQNDGHVVGGLLRQHVAAAQFPEVRVSGALHRARHAFGPQL
jgi:hypothetical protein